MRIATGVVGTFADTFLLNEKAGYFLYDKTPTTHDNLIEGVPKGLERNLRNRESVNV